jgi:hypothetical protein
MHERTQPSDLVNKSAKWLGYDFLLGFIRFPSSVFSLSLDNIIVCFCAYK